MKKILPPEINEQCSRGKLLISDVQKKITEGQVEKPKLVWLELTGCSGNIISLLDGFNPDIEYTITSMVDLVFDNSLIVKEGEDAIEQLFSVLDDRFILAIEGAIATKNNGLYNVIGRRHGKPLTALDAATILGEKASHVIAVGACAAHGGVSAARPNPAMCVSVQDILKGKKVIKLPGCPCHPDWFLGTLAHIILYGEPELDSLDRPLLFYSTLIHDRCPRRTFFNNGIFADKLGEPGCLFKLGCRGPVTRIDCPTRKWNGYVNWPIGDDTPCIGCAQFGFPDRMAPFISYDATEDN